MKIKMENDNEINLVTICQHSENICFNIYSNLDTWSQKFYPKISKDIYYLFQKKLDNKNLLYEAINDCNLSIIEYLFKSGYEWDDELLIIIIMKNRLDVLSWAHQNYLVKIKVLIKKSVKKNKINILDWIYQKNILKEKYLHYLQKIIIDYENTKALEWLLNKNYHININSIYLDAANHDKYTIIQYLYQNEKLPVNLIEIAAFSGNINLLSWAKKFSLIKNYDYILYIVSLAISEGYGTETHFKILNEFK